MARSTFGATNDTNEISPRKSRHAVGIREIRCRLRLREISLYQHGYKNSSHSSHSLLEKTVWNIRNLSYPKKIRLIRLIRCLKNLRALRGPSRFPQKSENQFHLPWREPPRMASVTCLAESLTQLRIVVNPAGKAVQGRMWREVGCVHLRQFTLPHPHNFHLIIFISHNTYIYLTPTQKAQIFSNNGLHGLNGFF